MLIHEQKLEIEVLKLVWMQEISVFVFLLKYGMVYVWNMKKKQLDICIN